MATLITSQEYRNAEIVSEKISNEDFAVYLSPVFEINGEEFQVVLDGHHSYAAAIEAGVQPEFYVQSPRDNDTIALLYSGNVEDFLTVNVIDGEYRHIDTGAFAW